MLDIQTVFVIDDDEGIREGISLLLETVDLPYEVFKTGLDFLEVYNPERRGCLVLDILMPKMTGLVVQEKLIEKGSMLPIIFITGHGDIPMAVEAMRRGAMDFIRKPFRENDLVDRIHEALEIDRGLGIQQQDRKQLEKKIANLTERERMVFLRVTEGQMNKVVASNLGISERTVQVHRANLMKKLGVRTLAELIHLQIEIEMEAETPLKGKETQ